MTATDYHSIKLFLAMVASFRYWPNSHFQSETDRHNYNFSWLTLVNIIFELFCGLIYEPNDDDSRAQNLHFYGNKCF